MKKILALMISLLIPATIFAQSADEYNKRGLDEYNLKDYRGAIEEFTKAIGADPKHIFAYYNRGLTKYKMEDFTGAILDFSTSLIYKPNDASAYYSRGMSKYYLQDYRGAVADYTLVIETISVEIDLSNIANARRETVEHGSQDYMMKMPDFTEDLEINPRFALAYFSRGKVRIILGLKESGCFDLKKANELGYALALDALEKYCM